MSGGVDSSAAALALRDEGWDVIGVTLHLWDYTREGHAGRCCAPEDQYDAARVCATLDIPHYTFDRRALFRARVVDRFIDDYTQGRTPSPCVRCNESVKLGPLYEIAQQLGADHIATGHYARITHDGEGVDLRAALDARRDQSYFLWPAPMDALRALKLPLGARIKPDVRALAARGGLVNADKPDSSDLCFVEGDNYTRFVEAHAPVLGPAGTLETLDGTVVGEHRGVHAFTVGQRRGVGASGAPRYVLRIVPERAAVIVGDDTEARVRDVTIEGMRWLCDTRPERVNVRLRYRHPGALATVHATHDTRTTLHLDTPERGVAPGQAAVLYVGDRVVGGGWIT
jgi:tRNA-specific 2-thiouridylase